MLGEIKRKLKWVYSKIRSYVLIKQAKFQAMFSGGSFTYSSILRFDSPVRCDGLGIVTLEPSVQIGYIKAPKIGSGEVLLQARIPSSKITIGDGTTISNNVSIIACSEIKIGKKCQIGDLVVIYDCDFHEINPKSRNDTIGEVIPVQIGNNVWIGSRVMILKGVTIGNNSVIAAGSIVTKSIPNNSLAAGCPAKVIRDI